MKTNISLIRGTDPYENVRMALDKIEKDIDLRPCQSILIKPNLVSPRHPPACTHPQALRAVLEFIRSRYSGRLMIAEGSALAPTVEAYQKFGYMELARYFGVELIDLNAEPAVSAPIYDRRMKTRTVRLARSAVESDYRISLCLPKTHDTAIVSLSLKNMVMGSLVNRLLASTADPQDSPVTQAARLSQRLWPTIARLPPVIQAILRRTAGIYSDKGSMHQGYMVFHLNLINLATWVWPHLSIIDGTYAMQGSGPIEGDAFEWGVTLASTDALAVDYVTTTLMGFDPAEVGYLVYGRCLGLGMSDLTQIALLGNINLGAARRPFRPHPNYPRQRLWHFPDAERWLKPKSAL